MPSHNTSCFLNSTCPHTMYGKTPWNTSDVPQTHGSIQSVTKYSLRNIKPSLIQCKNALKCKCTVTFWAVESRFDMLIFEVYSWLKHFMSLGDKVFSLHLRLFPMGKKSNVRTDCNTEQHVAELLYLVTDTKTPSVTLLHPWAQTLSHVRSACVS